MPRDTTPTYVVDVTAPGAGYTAAAWDCRRNGRPTDARLADYVASFEKSTMPGGVNQHLGATRVSSARVRRNYYGGDTVATYKAAAPAPLFTVVADSSAA